MGELTHTPQSLLDQIRREGRRSLTKDDESDLGFYIKDGLLSREEVDKANKIYSANLAKEFLSRYGPARLSDKAREDLEWGIANNIYTPRDVNIAKKQGEIAYNS